MAARIAEGLLTAHLFLGACFVLGSSLIPVIDSPGEQKTRAQALMAAASLTCIGVAALGFVLLVLAFIGALTPWAMLAALLAVYSVATVIYRRSPFSLNYWKARWDLLVRACDGGALIVYYCALLMSAPAVLPNVGGDPIHYHLAYAQDWASAGKLVIDPLLRFPFYASNFLLFDAALISVKAIAFINFITWAMGMLTGLAIYAAVRTIIDAAYVSRWNGLIAVSLALAVIASPVYWRWMVTAYMDVPIGALALFTLLCMYQAVLLRSPAWIFGAAVVGAYLVGCKPSFLLLLPAILVGLLLTGRRIGLRRSVIFITLALGIALASPWYIRNVVLAGDPMPPAINLALYGRDGFIDKSEWKGIQEDLATHKSPAALASLPFRAYFEPLTMDFREYGVSALMLALFIPIAFTALWFATGKRLDFEISLFLAALCILVAYWFGISSLLRYALILFPVLAICLAFCLAQVIRGRPRLLPVAAIIALTAMLPSPGASNWYVERYRNDYRYASAVFTGDDAYARVNDEGYKEEQFAVRTLKQRGISGVVYVIGGATEYFFRRDGYRTAGDWVGPGGWFRLYRAIDASKASEFLKQLGSKAVLIDPAFMAAGLDGPLESQLESDGYCVVAVPDSDYKLLIQDGTCSTGVAVR